MSYRLGVDVGGTFTDVLLVDQDSGATWRAKTASTPADQAVGVLTGIGRVCADAGIGMSEVAQVLHGTTVATNAILEGKGATVGTVVRPLDEDDVRRQLARLAGRGIQALAVSLINSFADPAHEKRIAAIAAEVLPGIPVSLSSDVLPEMREYERTLTTVANGYVQPQVKRYVQTLSDKLAEGGVQGELAILRSDGGLQSAEGAIGAPVTMLLSGPAGGGTRAVWVAGQCGYRDPITL